MGYLRQDADAVSRLSLRVFSGPVLQIFNDSQGIFHRRAAFSAFDIHAGADTAVIVFKLRPVERRLRNG